VGHPQPAHVTHVYADNGIRVFGATVVSNVTVALITALVVWAATYLPRKLRRYDDALTKLLGAIYPDNEESLPEAIRRIDRHTARTDARSRAQYQETQLAIREIKRERTRQKRRSE